MCREYPQFIRRYFPTLFVNMFPDYWFCKTKMFPGFPMILTGDVCGALQKLGLGIRAETISYRKLLTQF